MPLLHKHSPYGTTRARQRTSDYSSLAVSCNRMCAALLRWCHLVNAYGVKAGWFMPYLQILCRKNCLQFI